MSNMSYCRFENTLSDFKDCLESLESDGLDDLSDTEEEAAEALADAARKYLKEYDSLTKEDS